jgi:hypothetical protein
MGYLGKKTKREWLFFILSEWKLKFLSKTGFFQEISPKILKKT